MTFVSMGQHESSFSKIRRRTLEFCSSSSRRDMSLWKRRREEVNCLLNTEDYRNVTPLWLAARHNDVELAKLLLQYGADPNIQCGGVQMSPLHMATYCHNVEMVRALLEGGANPNLLDRWNYSPLMYAAIHHEPVVVMELFTLLLQYNCDINFGATLCRDRQNEQDVASGMLPYNRELPELRSHYDSMYVTYVREPMGPTSGTALHLAVQNPHLPNETIELLLNAGAEIDIQNLQGQTPLMGAMLDIYYDYHRNIKSHAELLIARGAKPRARDVRGWTCFHYAAQRGSISCIHQLSMVCADANDVSLVGESPLWILLVLGWREATKYLIRGGCQINQPIRSTIILSINQNVDLCRYGYILPIEFAVCNRYYNIAELMVKVGCVIDDDTWLGSHLDPPHTRHLEFRHFVSLVKRKKHRLKSLCELCRQSIRSTMKSGIVAKLEHVVLPHSLKDYICYNDL